MQTKPHDPAERFPVDSLYDAGRHLRVEMISRGEPNVGERIRALRDRQGLSLRALAQRCELSLNAISRIERCEASPTVASLHRLASALGVSVADLFNGEQENAVVVVRRNHRLGARTESMRMESLGSGLANQQIEPFLMTLEPGPRNMDEPVTHAGQEFALCLEGDVEFTVAEQAYRIGSGDSLLFEATLPHCFRNASKKRSVLLLVFQGGEAGHVARRRHLEVLTGLRGSSGPESEP